jgi:patatin-like phospholipase/acyl hydrolase
MAKYRIVSIDGGGIRGLIPAILLERLSREPGLAGWLESADLLAGTSTGGLIALALSAGKSPAEIRDMYVTKAGEIFDRTAWRAITSLGSLIGAKYDIANLERVIRPFLGGQTRLSQLRRRVLIASFDLDSGAGDPRGRTWKPKLFHNFPGPDSDGDELAYRVGLYTSAAPTYFAGSGGYVDGGVYAANPSMCALAQTQDPRIPDAVRLEDVVLLSMGTGISLQFIEENRPDWGDVQWIEPLLKIMLDGVSGIADYECRRLLRERYLRVAPVFPAGTAVDMDAADMIGYMSDFAESVDLTEAAGWLRAAWL